MTEKENVNSKINRLWIIGKFEADYNLILKLYWPKIINESAEDNELLGKNQLWKCKFKRATDGVLINEFIIEIARINHEPLTIQQKGRKRVLW